jgi:hypothetical protein
MAENLEFEQLVEWLVDYLIYFPVFQNQADEALEL